MDYLMTTAINAIEAKKPEMEVWLADKAREHKKSDRLTVLRWLACSLDAENRSIVEAALGVEEGDLDAVRRVLQKI
jgi:hypothetical protein